MKRVLPKILIVLVVFLSFLQNTFTHLYASTPPLLVDKVYFKKAPVQNVSTRLYIIISSSQDDFDGAITLTYTLHGKETIIMANKAVTIIAGDHVGLFTDLTFPLSGTVELHATASSISLLAANGQIPFVGSSLITVAPPQPSPTSTPVQTALPTPTTSGSNTQKDSEPTPTEIHTTGSKTTPHASSSPSSSSNVSASNQQTASSANGTQSTLGTKTENASQFFKWAFFLLLAVVVLITLLKPRQHRSTLEY